MEEALDLIVRIPQTSDVFFAVEDLTEITVLGFRKVNLGLDKMRTALNESIQGLNTSFQVGVQGLNTSIQVGLQAINESIKDLKGENYVLSCCHLWVRGQSGPIGET